MSEELLSTTARAAGPADAARRTPDGEPDAPAIGDWLYIECDGSVVVYTGKVEVGQHIRTSLAQAVAEELRLPLSAIRLVMADTDCTPFDMGTFGSRTTPTISYLLRQVAAATRLLLCELAANRLGVESHELVVADGRVVHAPTGRACSFGELARGRRLTETYAGAPITPPDKWTQAGTEVPPVDGVSIVSGAHRYTPDLTLPGMLAGAVLRPPSFGAALVSLDAAAAQALPGVSEVREGDFVGVTARDRHTALRARDSLLADWTATEHVPSTQLFDYLRANPAGAEDPPRWPLPLHHEQGQVEAARAVAELTFAQSYSVAYIAHAPLEARAALAHWAGGRLTVWTGTQRPFGVRGELSEAFQIPEEAIRVIVPDTGSAYGGKHTGEAAIEAARLARAT